MSARDMAVFDRLPPCVRQAIVESDHHFSAGDAKLWLQFSSPERVAANIRKLNKILALEADKRIEDVLSQGGRS